MTEQLSLALARKALVLVFLALLLYSTFLLTGSLAIVADALYAVVDALFVFSLWLTVLLVARNILSKTAVKLVSSSIFILSLVTVFSSSLILYTSLLAFGGQHVVQRPELVVASELLFIFILFYIYMSLREEAILEDVRALVYISRSVEQNIIGSFMVIVAGVFSMLNLHLLDAIIAAIISIIVLYRSLVLSYRSFRSIFGFSDPVLVDGIVGTVRETGARPVSVELIGIGPYYLAEIEIDARHLPDKWDRVEEIVRRRVERILPEGARVIIKGPGGGI